MSQESENFYKPQDWNSSTTAETVNGTGRKSLMEDVALVQYVKNEREKEGRAVAEEIKKESGVYVSEAAVEWWKMGKKVRVDSTDIRKIRFGKDIDNVLKSRYGSRGE